ncbi:MAG: fumarylacetoacetate hydrolase family protein [Salaquimonas sp.]|jgi:fumarylpyruvate hydrolase|nr:fumarylacetoacetate hydrolase family protein [Salaquimonas sp.]
MTEYVFTPPPLPSVAIAGTDHRFPLRRIFCVGRNYAAHAREMGNDPDGEPPFFFMKPADAVCDSGSAVPYPPLTSNLHHEIELVVAIAKAGHDIDPADALGHVWGYAAGVDLTRRDLQDQAKANRRPWDWSKGFDHSAVCGELVPVAESGHPDKGFIRLSVNGSARQDADLGELIWPVNDIVAFASRSVELRPGDLFFTGTPAGVGPLVAGDKVNGEIENVGTVAFSISPRPS